MVLAGIADKSDTARNNTGNGTIMDKTVRHVFLPFFHLAFANYGRLRWVVRRHVLLLLVARVKAQEGVLASVSSTASFSEPDRSCYVILQTSHRNID